MLYVQCVLFPGMGIETVVDPSLVRVIIQTCTVLALFLNTFWQALWMGCNREGLKILMSSLFVVIIRKLGRVG